MPLLVGRLLVVAAAASAKFSATFEGDSTAPFVESTNDRYANQDVGIVDGALMLKEPNRMYGVAAEIKPPFKLDDKLVIQYESTLTDGLTCGGAYVKLLESPVDTSKFDNESPYVLMFGPDRCGATDKVHFIVRQKNPKSNTWYEHHLRDAPRAKADRSPHLYKAVINSDDTFAIYIDDEEAFSGSLMDALEPPLTPPKEIDDPDDSKPKDWVDAAKIDDPEASKPDDWDEDAPREIDDATATMPAGWLEDEPLLIPDPSAEAPDDWDDEEDGEWEAPEIANPKCDKAPGCGPWSPPKIDNPDYKGKWYPPQIDNPDYKGPWAPRKIPNKEFFEPKNPSKNLKPVGAVAVEVWTTNGGIAYDNFYLGGSEVEAKDSAASYYAKKEEEARKAAEKKAQKAAKRAAKGKGWRGLLLKAKKVGQTVLDKALDQPLAAGGTLLVLIVTLLMTRKKKAVVDEDEAEEEDDDEDGDAGGFEYDGDISDAALEGAGAKNGVPRDVFALDIGQQTIESFRASLNRASTIFWSGAVGSVECSAFQQGTRDVAEACAEAAAERKALVVIAGRTATTWARNFAGDADDDENESGVCLVDADGRNAFAHILCGGPFAPCLDAVPRREPTDDERLLPAELAQKQREAAEASDAEEDDDEEGDY